MWRGKKFLVIMVLAAVLLAGGIGGVALAQEEEDDAQPESQRGALLEKVCEIYEENTGVAIDAEALKDAFVQASREMIPEKPERFRLPICGPMFGRVGIPGIHGNILEELGINVDELEGLREEIKAVCDEVKNDVESEVLTPDEAGAVIKDKILEILESYGIDTEALEAARSEALGARKGGCAEGEGSFGHRFIFRSRGGHCVFGKLFAPQDN